MSPDGSGNGNTVSTVIITTPTTTSNTYLLRGFIALGVSFVATAFAARSFMEASRVSVLEAGDAVLEAAKVAAE